MAYSRLQVNKKEKFWKDLVKAGNIVLTTGERQTAKRMLYANEMVVKRCNPNSKVLRKYRLARKELF